MTRAAIAVVIIAVTCAIIAGFIVIYRAHEDPIITIQAGGGWTIVLGPQNLLHDKNSKFYIEGVDLQGMCWYNQKLVYVVCKNSVEVAREWPTLGASYAKVFKGGAPDHADPFYGWMAHEILGHGSDHSVKGRPLLFINIIWPQSLPREEAILAPVQNPWTTIARAWPGCQSPHFDLPSIPADHYLESKVP